MSTWLRWKQPSRRHPPALGPGDEVITTPISWVATANVILEVGATPVFADIDPVTRNIDLAQVEAAITP
ncbi:DegT/DnrJ/EryC1/StrS family aminotransferase, partial [Corynebacterium diphtheriae]